MIGITQRLRYRFFFFSLLLVLMTWVIFFQMKDHDFTHYDDTLYVLDNEYVLKGFTRESLAWVWTSNVVANWHPLTMLSHMLDAELFGLWAGGHHLTSLVLHTANVLLLFLIFFQMTGAMLRSAFAAALFAVHPLHVESVAWVSERKDVLSLFFGLWAVCAYHRFSKKTTLARYVPVLIFYIFALMSKPMLVSLPLLFLLLDHWPLNRIESWNQRFLEKIPLFMLMIFSCWITLNSQTRCMRSLVEFPLGVRIENAAVSYVQYLYKTFFPSHLGVVYSHPGDKISTAVFLGAFAVLLFLTAASLRYYKKIPYFWTGWFWFLITLVPVIGLVQVGEQGMADRYMYLPSVGLFLTAAWALGDKVRNFFVKAVLASAAVIVLSGMAWKQVSYWKNTETLVAHTLAVTKDNYLAHNIIGGQFSKKGDLEDAIRHQEKAVALRPNHPTMLYNLAFMLKKSGKINEAISWYFEALKYGSEADNIHFNLAMSLAEVGRTDEAISYYLHAMQLFPRATDTYHNLGNLFLSRGEIKKAQKCFERLVKVNPVYDLGLADLAGVYEKNKQYDEAIRYYLKALDYNPQNENAYQRAAKLLVDSGKFREAAAFFREKLKWKPEDAGVHFNLALVEEQLHNNHEAAKHYAVVLRLNPGDAQAKAAYERTSAGIKDGTSVK